MAGTYRFVLDLGGGDPRKSYARTRSAPTSPAALQPGDDGGGACWNAATCGREGTGIHGIVPAFYPNRQWGILDACHAENPLAGYTLVALPYCTSDLHLGDRDVTYSTENARGRPFSFTVRHRGQANAGAVLDWLFDNIEAPEQIVVAGSSAGGLAVPFYAHRIAMRYPGARIIAIGDDIAAFRSEAARDVEEENWGWPEAMERQRGWSGFGSVVGSEALYSFVARAAPNVELHMIDHAHDRDQALFLRLAGYDSLGTAPLIRQTREDLERASDSFRSFTMGGSEHTVLNHPRFYFSAEGVERLHDWFDAIIAGSPVATVECSDCALPTYLYGTGDLTFIEGAVELLNSAGWNPDDDWRRCPDTPEVRLSLRCAVVLTARALNQVERPRDGARPAFYALRAAADQRLEPGADAPLIRFNNDPNTTFEDVLALLTERSNWSRRGCIDSLGVGEK
jgi:hypothetical protein